MNYSNDVKKVDMKVTSVGADYPAMPSKSMKNDTMSCDYAVMGTGTDYAKKGSGVKNNLPSASAEVTYTA